MSSSAPKTRSQKLSMKQKGKKKLPSSPLAVTPAVASDCADSSPDSGRSSPDSPCAICLGRHENKCFTNNCLHEFCFSCLLEWSKVKPECPLCKQGFSAIIHNIRSNQEYDEYKVQAMQPEEPDLSAYDLFHGRFRYRTTLTHERRRVLELERLVNLRSFLPDALPTTRSRPRRSRLTGTSDFRRSVYFTRDEWVRPLSDITGRYRETTPEFFSLNPAMTHRLVPWLNRELNVLLSNHANRLSYVLELILRLITQHHIRSRPFREALHQYLTPHTEHFIHEFFQFARSPYDMYGFDENAQYEPRPTLQHEEVAVSESSDDDDDDEGLPVVGAHATVSSRSSPFDIPLPPSPQPGPSGLGRILAATLSDDGQSYSVRVPAHSSGTTSATTLSATPSDQEDVEVVEVIRPRTPEIITLSDSEEEHKADTSTDSEAETTATTTTTSTSRGKALKRRLKSPPPPPPPAASRKDKCLKVVRKRKKANRSRSSGTSRDWHRHEEDQEPVRPQRYWDMDPEDIRRLRNVDEDHSSSSSSSRSRSHKRHRRS